ncbi:hypothetical protein ABKV19_016798 [Rosa sericea]
MKRGRGLDFWACTIIYKRVERLGHGSDIHVIEIVGYLKVGNFVSGELQRKNQALAYIFVQDGNSLILTKIVKFFDVVFVCRTLMRICLKS